MTAETSPAGRLDYLDQAGLELLRATGRGQLMQAVWIYEHPVDPEGLARLHRSFGIGLLGRLIERSPVPFGRPRWVSVPGPQCDIVSSPQPRPRDEVMDWADELARLPIDPERGPGWLLGTVALTDGSTAVSIVFSHCLVDGGGAILTLFNALSGNPQDFGYDIPRSRRWRAAVLSDLRDSMTEMPRTMTALKAAAGLLRGQKNTGAGQSAPLRRVESEEALDTVVGIPAAVAFVDIAHWDDRAAALGGNSFSLVAGYAARLAGHLGRSRPSDNAVTLIIAGNGRTAVDDDRALAMTFANTAVDPETVTTSLTDARNAIRDAREKAKTEQDPAFGLLPLIPWFSRRMVKALAGLMFSYDEAPPVSCSNVGDIPDLLTQADGSPAEFFFARSVDQNVTLRDLQRSNGTLVVVSGRISGKIWIAVEAYELGAENSNSRLRAVIEQTLADFEVTGTVF